LNIILKFTIEQLVQMDYLKFSPFPSSWKGL